MSLRVVMIALMLLAAAALGLIAFQISGPSRNGPVTQAPPAPPAASYLVTARRLPAGTLAKPDDIASKSVPQAQLPADAILDTPANRAELKGALVHNFMDTGTPIRTADITRPHDRGFLASVLPAGTRAVAIAVDPVSGVAGLVWPGDRVDILLTQDFPASGEAKRIVTAETILTDVRIIAVDQDITQGAPVSGAAGRLAATVTLQVGNDQAEKLAVSRVLGKLSLAVRSIADEAQPIVVTPGGVSGADVSDAYSRANAVGGPRMQLIQGDKRSEVNFK